MTFSGSNDFFIILENKNINVNLHHLFIMVKMVPSDLSFQVTSEILFRPVNLRHSLVLSCDFSFLISLTNWSISKNLVL